MNPQKLRNKIFVTTFRYTLRLVRVITPPRIRRYNDHKMHYILQRYRRVLNCNDNMKLMRRRRQLGKEYHEKNAQ